MKMHNPMFHVWVFVIACLFSPLGTLRASDIDVAALEPCLNDQTVALVRLDVTRFHVEALADKMEAILRTFGGEAVVQQSADELAGFRSNVSKAVLDLKKIGGKSIYAIFNMLDLPYFVIAVPIPLGADGEAIEVWVQENQKAFRVGKLKVHRVKSVVLVGLERSVNMLLAMPAKKAPVWQAALQSCGDTALQVVLAPDVNQRRVLVEMMPNLRFPDREKMLTFLSKGLAWIGMGVQGPPTILAQLTVEAVDETQAQSLLSWVKTIQTCVAQEPDFQKVPKIREHVYAMTPIQAETRLSLHVNASQSDWLIEQLVGPSLVSARKQALKHACETNMSGIGKALLIYANDHKDNFPPDLKTLIQACEMTPRGLVCPAVETEDSYVYRGKGIHCSHDPDMVMVYERKGNHIGVDGRNVLFMDSHVEWMTEEAFQKAIKKDNEYRQKKGLPILPIEG